MKFNRQQPAAILMLSYCCREPHERNSRINNDDVADMNKKTEDVEVARSRANNPITPQNPKQPINKNTYDPY